MRIAVFVMAAGLAGCGAPSTGRIERTVHVGASPDRVWRALTDGPALTAYWSGEWRFESDWKTGSPVKYVDARGDLYSEGRVLESAPTSRLVYTWPEPGSSGSAERLAWTIERSGPEVVKLTLVHDGLAAPYVERCGAGWELVLSSLKSYVERGAALTFDPKED